MGMTGRKTSANAARAALKVLLDSRTSKASKTAAASALSQRAPSSASKKGSQWGPRFPKDLRSRVVPGHLGTS